MIKKCDICGVRWSTNQYPPTTFADENECPATRMYNHEYMHDRGHLGETKVICHVYTCKKPCGECGSIEHTMCYMYEGEKVLCADGDGIHVLPYNRIIQYD